MRVKMEISVLMPIYDKEKPDYLEKALESMVKQTVLPKQIVIVKDGELTQSLDAVLEKYQKQFPEIIDIYLCELKLGLGEVLKFGVEKCQCKYIARMDSDDIAVLDRFEKQSQVFESNPELDLLGGFIEEYDESMQNLQSIRKVPLTLEEIKEYIKKQCPFNHGTVMMKKEAILKAGNYNRTQLEDYDLWARMLINGCQMANMDAILGKNRAGDSLYARRSGIKQIKKIIEIEKNLYHYGLIDRFTCMKNSLIRSLVALLPIPLKRFVYTKGIRKIAT